MKMLGHVPAEDSNRRYVAFRASMYSLQHKDAWDARKQQKALSIRDVLTHFHSEDKVFPVTFRKTFISVKVKADARCKNPREYNDYVAGLQDDGIIVVKTPQGTIFRLM